MFKARLKPSWLLAVILSAAHLCAIALVGVVDIPVWSKIVVVAALLLQCTLAVTRYALLQGSHAGIALEVTSDHTLNVESRFAGWRAYDVLGSTYVTPYLAILNLRDAQTRASTRITLLPDSLHADDFRKLRVWLRWKEDRAQP